MSWTVQDSIVEGADYLEGIANSLDAESKDWSIPVRADSCVVDYGELRRRSLTVWVREVEAGAVLLKLAKAGAFDKHPRIKHVVFQCWSDLKKKVNKGEVPWADRLGVPNKSYDLFLVRAFEDACRLWHGKHNPFPIHWGQVREKAVLFAAVLRQIAADLRSRFRVTTPED